MSITTQILERKLTGLGVSLAVVMPDGERVGPADAKVVLKLRDLAPLAHVAAGEVGRVAQEYVEGRLDIQGSMREVMAVAASMIDDDPTHSGPPAAPLRWWGDVIRRSRSRARHDPESDKRQIQFHYDVSDEFYALWLDPRRVYSCAYYREPGMDLAQAQEAKP